MNPAIELNLALLLFLPWFLILGVLFCAYPKQPRGARRVLFDVMSLAIAVIAFLVSIHWAQGIADRSYGHMWQQVLATAVGYGVFLAVLGAAVAVRMRVLRPRR